MEAPPQQAGFRPPVERVAFLISQLGAYASNRFAERVAELDLQPSDVGLLRMIAVEPGLSQQALAGKLGVVPSRVVALIDGLERRDLVTRTRSTKDRRNYELHLSEKGREAMAQMRRIGFEHETELLADLDDDERRALGDLLFRLASSHGLEPEVHPGYRSVRD